MYAVLPGNICFYSILFYSIVYYPATMTPCKQRKSRFSTTRSLDPEHQGTGGTDNTHREWIWEKKHRGLNSTGADDERKLGVGFLYEWSAKFRATKFLQNLTKILQNLAKFQRHQKDKFDQVYFELNTEIPAKKFLWDICTFEKIIQNSPCL